MQDLAERDHFQEKYNSPLAKQERDMQARFDQILGDIAYGDCPEEVADDFTTNQLLKISAMNWKDDAEAGREIRRLLTESIWDAVTDE